MSDSYNVDDILNADDSDEDDIDSVSIDLEKLLDDDDDEDDNDFISSEKVPNISDLHLYSDSNDEDNKHVNVNETIEVLEPPLPSDLFNNYSNNIPKSPDIVNKELDDLLRDEFDEVESHSKSSLPLSVTDEKKNNALHTLELAEKREKRHMYTGDKDTLSALQSKLQFKKSLDDKNDNKDDIVEKKGSGSSAEINIITHFKCVCLEMISTQLHRNAQFKQHGPGTATVVKFTTKFIALGTSRGLVLIFDHNQEMRQVIGSSVPTAGRNVYAISALDVSASGDFLFCGYENGEIIIWDVAKGNVIKRLSDVHSGRIVKLCVVYGVGEDAASITGISNEYTIISVDSKGVVNKTKLTKSMFLSISVESECLLDGSAGAILDLSPLCSFSTLMSYPDIITPDDGSGNVQSMKSSSMTDCPSFIPRMDQYIALNSSVRSYVIRVYPQVKIVHRWVAPSSVAKKSKDFASSRKSVAIAKTSTSATYESQPSNTTMNILAKDEVSLDWIWMPSNFYSELKVASNSAKSLLNPTGPLIHPVILRGWGDTLEILALIPPTVTSSYNPATGTSNPVSSTDIEAVVLATHVLPNSILTVKWLSNHASIVVMTTKDVLVLNIPSFSSERLPVTKDICDILSKHTDARSLDNIPMISISVSRERMYLLATEKMYMFYLQSWQEQAEQLLNDGQWLDALAYVLGRYQSLEGSLTPSQQTTEEKYLKDYIKRYADLAIVRNTDHSAELPSSLLTLDSGSSGRGKTSGHHFLVASICIEYCVLAGGSLSDYLYSEVYGGFVSAQLQSIFMEALEPFIVRRQITDLPTKVFSDLVEYCGRAQQYSLLERMVCHLDLTDADVDNLVRSLKRARLYSGFLYVHAYGLNDYGGAFVSVFEDMLLATGRSKSDGTGYRFPTPQQVDIGYKIILFIKYSATGQVFPRGGKTIVSALCLTQLVELLICKEYPPTPMKKNSGSNSSAPISYVMNTEALTSPQMTFSYPFLYSLSQIDLYAMYHTMAEAFKTIYGNSDNGNIVKLNNNNLYFESFGAMFSSVLEFAKYADNHCNPNVSSMGENSGGGTAMSTSFNIAHQLCFFELFLDLITTSNVSFSMDFLCAVIQHCQKQVKNPPNRAESLVDSLVSRQMKYLPSTPQVYKRLAMELEQNFFFMSSLKLCAVSSKYRYKPNPDTLRTAIVCYIQSRPTGNVSSSNESSMKVFPYIHEFFDHLDNTTANDFEGEYATCCQILVEFIQELAGVNLQNTQMIMVMYLHDNVELVMDKTKKQQKLQFELLDAMVRGVMNKNVTATEEPSARNDEKGLVGQNDVAVLDANTESKTEVENAAVSTVEMLQPATPLSDSNVLVYISHLATFEPSQVLQFLSTHSNYPLDEALSVCKKKCIFNATAYLLERAGDSMAALELCLMEISTTLPELNSKVEEMVTDALLHSHQAVRSSHFAQSVSLLQLLRNPSPSKLIEVFQHLEEFTKFNEIIHLITGICSRIDTKTSTSYSHWFHVLDELLKVKHTLINPKSSSNDNVRDSILQDLGSTDVDAQMAKELVGLVVGQALKGFMSKMGGTVPSQDIVRRITQEEMMGSRFSEFKDVMISMVDSFSYEIALFKTCLRITTSDLLLVRAKRMKLKHRGIRCNETFAPKESAITSTEDVDLLPTELQFQTKEFQAINHRSNNPHAGGLVRKRHGSDYGKKEIFEDTTNVIDLAARVVISTELPQVSDFDQVNADIEERVPGTLPFEASFVASYDGFLPL